MTEKMIVNIHFSDFFGLSPEVLDEYGAFDISLVNDLPLFIDPFLIFNSTKPDYKNLHESIIRYLKFLRNKSLQGSIATGLIGSWYHFGEVKQNWLGYSMVGNSGSGLGRQFASALYKNLGSIFSDFGTEQITKGSHLEKVCLVSDGIGRDNISDFATNLVKNYLLEYTQTFTKKYISTNMRKRLPVEKVRFNYTTETWERDWYELPYFNNDYILLTPKDMLTKDDVWISSRGLYEDFSDVALSIPNEQLKDQINNYFLSILPPNPVKKERNAAISSTIEQFPQFIEYYIRYKEDHGSDALAVSSEKVLETETLFVRQVNSFAQNLIKTTLFYKYKGTTYDEALIRVNYLKDVIENKDGYRVFYVDGKPLKRENDLQILFRLTWCGTLSDVNREVNNGRGPVDFKISRGSSDMSLVEFKLASNPQLKRNLQNQVAIYEQANNTKRSITVILYFSAEERARVNSIFTELKIENRSDIVLIDARADNKPSASVA